MSEYQEDIDLETIEVSVEQAKKQVALMNNLERLTKNRDFKAIMLEGYFEREPVRLTLLKADAAMQKPEYQEQIIKDIDSIGRVRQYFSAIMQMGRMAHKELESLEETREEILSGESGE